MIVDVELTRRDNDRYAARALQFPDVIVEAVSREEALAQMKEALLARQRVGLEIVQIELEPIGETAQSVWPRHAGSFRDDEAYRMMLAEVERERRALDVESNP